jgi:hypothetical protein
MKFKLFSTLILLFLLGNAFAQKNVNVDNLRFNYLERQLPQKLLSPPFFYYTVKLDLPGSIRNFVDEQGLYEMVNIVGQRVTYEPSNDDVIINAKMSPVIILGSSVKERIAERKARDGTVTKEHFYTMEIIYNFEANAVVVQKGKILNRYTMCSRTQNFTFRSIEYKTQKETSDFWRNNREVLIEQFTRERAENSIASLSKSLNNTFGFPIIRQSALIKTINEKNHPENETLRDNSNEIKSRMETLDGTIPLTEDDMADLIEYFESIPDRYSDATSKADIQLRYVAYFNLCRIYLFINQPQKVKKLADLLFANGQDKKDGQTLKKEADAMAKRFDKSIFKTAQFDTDDYFTD